MPDNLLLLCRKDHKIIDDHEDEYTIERLRGIRSDFLGWLSDNLANALPWKLNVSAFTYLNVPRLSEFASLHGYSIRIPEFPEIATLRDLGYGLNAVMNSFRSTLERISFQSVPASEIQYVHPDYIGQIVNFGALRFRTKNIPTRRPKATTGLNFSGDLLKDPHIYHRFEGWSLVININPKWITTDTAYGLFRPTGGASTFTGFARISDVDLDNRVILASAFAIGLPHPKFDIFGDRQNASVGAGIDLATLEDEATCARQGEWHGDLKCCDFCGRDFALERYMVDGPKQVNGPWGCMCEGCYKQNLFPLGGGKGQLYRRFGNRWLLVGGYPLSKEYED